MIRHEMPLWAFANKELELGEHRFLEAHLEDCPECTEQLAAIRLAREALDLARGGRPALEWTKTDERIGAMVEKQLARQARAPLFRRLSWGGGVLVAVAAAVTFMFWPKPEPLPLPEIDGTVPTSSWARVERAEGLSRVGGEKGSIADGTELHGGDVIRTSMVGRAFVHLPDQSHLRVAGGSQLALTRTESDDVALTLERGTVAVRASHQLRKGFVVHTGGVSVQVVGTVFGVANDADVVEVSVSEGKVRVELPNGEEAFVEPGQRLRFDSRTQKVKQLKVTSAMEKQLAEVVAADDAVTAVESRTMVAAVGGTPSAPPMVTAQGTPRSLPRLSPQEARARQATPPLTVQEPAPVPQAQTVQPQTQVEIEIAAPAAKPVEKEKVPDVVIPAPVDVWPSLGGGEVIRGVPPRREPEPASQPAEWNEAPKEKPAPTSDANEWSAMPEAAAPVPAPALVPATTATARKSPAKDLEAIFMARAEEGVASGNCDRFMLGLEEIAQDAQRSPRTEQARVLRARCLDAQMRPRQAMSEYRKYVEEYPHGRFVDEAQQALGN